MSVRRGLLLTFSSDFTSYDMVTVLTSYVDDIIRFLIITVSVNKKRVTFDVFFRFNPSMVW